MVQLRTSLHVLDNSGVKTARRIQVKGMKKRPGSIGKFVVASVTKAIPSSSFKKGDIVRGYLVTTVYGMTRNSGVHLRFPKNGLVLVNKKLDPIASRVMSPLPYDLRRFGRVKRLSMASHSV